MGNNRSAGGAYSRSDDGGVQKFKKRTTFDRRRKKFSEKVAGARLGNIIKMSWKIVVNRFLHNVVGI